MKKNQIRPKQLPFIWHVIKSVYIVLTWLQYQKSLRKRYDFLFLSKRKIAFKGKKQFQIKEFYSNAIRCLQDLALPRKIKRKLLLVSDPDTLFCFSIKKENLILGIMVKEIIKMSSGNPNFEAMCEDLTSQLCQSDFNFFFDKDELTLSAGMDITAQHLEFDLKAQSVSFQRHGRHKNFQSQVIHDLIKEYPNQDELKKMDFGPKLDQTNRKMVKEYKQ